MSRHRMKRNEFRLGNGEMVTIDSWIDSTSVHVAAFDMDGHQISLAEYQASIDSTDNFSAPIQAALVDSLANALEYDLMNHPEIHVRKRVASPVR